MNKFKKNIVYKVICSILVISFITMDISWANPDIGSSTVNTHTLMQPTIFTSDMGAQNLDPFVGASKDAAMFMFSMNNIANYIFLEPFGFDQRMDYFADIMNKEYPFNNKGIDYSNVYFEDEIITVPYKISEDNLIYVQIAEKTNSKAKDLIGYDFNILPNYVCKILTNNPIKETIRSEEVSLPIIEEPVQALKGENMVSPVRRGESTYSPKKNIKPKKPFNGKFFDLVTPILVASVFGIIPIIGVFAVFAALILIHYVYKSLKRGVNDIVVDASDSISGVKRNFSEKNRKLLVLISFVSIFFFPLGLIIGNYFIAAPGLIISLISAVLSFVAREHQYNFAEVIIKNRSEHAINDLHAKKDVETFESLKVFGCIAMMVTIFCFFWFGLNRPRTPELAKTQEQNSEQFIPSDESQQPVITGASPTGMEISELPQPLLRRTPPVLRDTPDFFESDLLIAPDMLRNFPKQDPIKTPPAKKDPIKSLPEEKTLRSDSKLKPVEEEPVLLPVTPLTTLNVERSSLPELKKKKQLSPVIIDDSEIIDRIISNNRLFLDKVAFDKWQDKSHNADFMTVTYPEYSGYSSYYGRYVRVVIPSGPVCYYKKGAGWIVSKDVMINEGGRSVQRPQQVYLDIYAKSPKGEKLIRSSLVNTHEFESMPVNIPPVSSLSGWKTSVKVRSAGIVPAVLMAFSEIFSIDPIIPVIALTVFILYSFVVESIIVYKALRKRQLLKKQKGTQKRRKEVLRELKANGIHQQRGVASNVLAENKDHDQILQVYNKRSEELEGFLNNRKAKLIREIQILVEKCKENGISLGSINENSVNDGSKKLMDKMIHIIGEIDENDLSEELKGLRDKIVKDLPHVYVDSMIASLIVKAREAKRKYQKIVIGIETDWIPGYKTDTEQHNSFNPLITQIMKLPDILKSMGIDNVIIVHANDKDLTEDVFKKAKDEGVASSNIIVLAGLETIEYIEKYMKGIVKEDHLRPILAAVDTVFLDIYLEKNPDQIRMLDIDIMAMLAITLEVATGKDIPASTPLYKIDPKTKKIIFRPCAKKDTNQLRVENSGYTKTLQSA